MPDPYEESRSEEEIARSVAAGDQLDVAAALYAFCGWLTTRPEVTVLSSHHDVAPIADLVNIFCRHNEIRDPDMGETNYTHPENIPSETIDTHDQLDVVGAKSFQPKVSDAPEAFFEQFGSLKMRKLDSLETGRTYHYFDGTKLNFPGVTHLNVKRGPNGHSHRLRTADGDMHYVAAGWLAITFHDLKSWTL